MSKKKDRLEELERKVNVLWEAGYADEIKLIKEHLGFYSGYIVFGGSRPQNTVYELIRLILDYFDLKVETTPAETKLVKRKKEDKPTTHRANKLTAKQK